MMKFVIIALMTLESLARINDSSVEQANIYYQQALRFRTPKELQILEVENLENKQNIKVIVHGYLANRGHSSVVPVKNAYLSQGTENIFLADWERAAAYDYPTSRSLIVRIAERFAGLLAEFMEKNEIDPNEIHLIGHSLGAHIVGYTGRAFFNGTLGRITGLDPALPLFFPHSNDGLQRNDAKFVDVIHTDFPVFGDLTPRGKIDFYPNYGRALQPGCTESGLKSLITCSHFRAPQLYAESISIPDNFPAIPCSLANIVSYPVKRCKRESTFNTTVFMGEFVEKSAHGEYFLMTNEAPPFGQGEYSDIYRNVDPVSEP